MADRDDLAVMAHLMRRAGFGAAREERRVAPDEVARAAMRSPPKRRPSKRRRPGATNDPAWRTWDPSVWRSAAWRRWVAV